IGFAKYQSSGPVGRIVANGLTKLAGLLQAISPERLVQCFTDVPGVQPDADSAAAVVNAASDEFHLIAVQIDNRTIANRFARQFERRIQHPRMSAIERSGSPGPHLNLRLGKSLVDF